MTDSSTLSFVAHERREWLRQVSRHTRSWRHARAARMERTHPHSVWHHARAKGLREREERAVACGVDGLERSCSSCGEVAGRVVRLTCSHWRLCQPCRARRADRALARFHAGRELALERLRSRMHYRSRGGRWAEVFYTFTLPHVEFERDAREVVDAWARFRRLLGHYLEARGCSWREVPFFRALEVTSSTGGHWHLHVWSVLPYVPQWLLAHLWGASLSHDYQRLVPRRSAADLAHVFGRDADALAWLELEGNALLAPIVDIRRAEHAGAELAKYMVKDMERGELVSPLWYARAYQTLEGMRSHESSRKWLVARPHVGGWHPSLSPRATKPLCECGECLPSSKRKRGHFLEPLLEAG